MNRYEQRKDFGWNARSDDEQCTPDIFMAAGFCNIGVITTEEGLVLVDVGLAGQVQERLMRLREKTSLPVHTIILTHGHLDHVGGIGAFIEEARENGYPRPRIIAHKNVARRYDRYRMLSRYNIFINKIQHVSRAGYDAPPEGVQFMPKGSDVYPDITYSDSMQFRTGSLTFELYHYMGESDDGTWVWIPERKIAIAGDVVECACPNVGNPFKVQRYTREWAEDLENIAGKNPDFIIPGHGPLLKGDSAREVCLDTAKFMRHIHDEVVRLLNEGYWQEDILHMVKIPEELLKKPWLQQVYGCATFIIHGVLRQYAGWYNGNPSDLFPARSQDIAREMVHISGSDNIIEHARNIYREGNIQLALNVLDFVVRGTDDTFKQKEALLLKSELLDKRAKEELNQIASNIFLVGADMAEKEANSL